MSQVLDTETIESNEDYHSDYSRISNSMLSVLKREPKDFNDYYVAKTRKPPASTESMMLGHVVHCLVLEPEAFSERYAIAPEGIDRRTNVGKETLRLFCELSQGKEVLKQEVATEARLCAASLLSHETVAAVVAGGIGNAFTEHRIDFNFCDVDMRCKVDRILVDAGLILDVKTTRDVRPDRFKYSCRDFGYVRQAALYCEAAKQKYGRDFRFIFACVATSSPYSIALYELSDVDLQSGLAEAETLLAEYKARYEANDWLPVYSKGINRLEVPKYGNDLYLFESDESEGTV
jgi:hypothetical protein